MTDLLLETRLASNQAHVRLPLSSLEDFATRSHMKMSVGKRLERNFAPLSASEPEFLRASEIERAGISNFFGSGEKCHQY